MLTAAIESQGISLIQHKSNLHRLTQSAAPKTHARSGDMERGERGQQGREEGSDGELVTVFIGDRDQPVLKLCIC